MQNPHPLSQVYSFVPIPGAQQHKRPRRRYEEIERMYKCGWQGCEKAYGTLNHLNAHVTMQSHGQKRTPEGTCEVRIANARMRLDSGRWDLAHVSRVTQHEPPILALTLYRSTPHLHAGIHRCTLVLRLAPFTNMSL